MHEYANFHRLFNILEDALHNVDSLLRFGGKMNLAPLGVDDVSQHGSCEIQAEHVHFNGEGHLY